MNALMKNVFYTTKFYLISHIMPNKGFFLRFFLHYFILSDKFLNFGAIEKLNLNPTNSFGIISFFRKMLSSRTVCLRLSGFQTEDQVFQLTDMRQIHWR